MIICAKKLVKMATKWQKFSALQRKRIPFTIHIDGGSNSSVVDKGHFAIYSADHRRFVVPLTYLNSCIFRHLLKMSEEEYGLPRDGPIVFPWDSIFMDYVLRLIRQGGVLSDLHEALLPSVAGSRCSSSSSCLNQGRMSQQLQQLIH